MIVFTFKNSNVFEEAVKVLKRAIDFFKTQHFNFNYQPKLLTIRVSEDHAPIVKKYFEEHKIKDFTTDRDYRRVVKAFMSNLQSKPVIRKIRVSEDSYDICPHCNSEIGEKEMFWDTEGLYGKPGQEYHRKCRGPVNFPEADFTEYSDKWLTPELLQIKERQVKEKQKKSPGRIFYFRIRTFGDTDNKHDFSECHPECEYLNWKQNDYGFCNLFKKDLGKCRCMSGSGAIRCAECASAVEGLI